MNGFPLMLPIQSMEELDTLHCAIAEFNDSDLDTRIAARSLEIKLTEMRKHQQNNENKID